MYMTMKQICRVTISMALLIIFQSELRAQDPAEIIERMDQTMRGKSSYAEMTMKIERPRYEREISMRSWLLGRDYSLIVITAPARDEGTAYLMHEDRIWNYDPNIDRVTRLPSSMMAQSWLGSDFTNDDLVRDSDIVADYEHELLRTESYQDRECYVIEMVPRPDIPIVWGKVVVWVSADNYMQLRVENYDQQMNLVNTMELDEVRQMDDREIPTRMTVIPFDTDDERTILTYETIAFDIDIEEEFFTRQNMQRVR